MFSLNPECFSIGAVHVRWYGIMAALGMLAGYTLINRRAPKYSIDQKEVSDYVFTAMVAGLIGARCLYVIRFWKSEFADGNFSEIFKIYNGGLVFLGGFAVAMIAVIVLCKIKKTSVADVADLFAPALPLGHSFGRLGCLLNGCCFGFEYNGPFSFTYRHVEFSTFPLQFFAAIGNVCICLFILLAEKKKWLNGRRFFLYMMIYSIGRFAIEFGRGDYPESQLWHSLTPAQVTCLWLLPLAVICTLVTPLFMSSKKKDTEPANGKRTAKHKGS